MPPQSGAGSIICCSSLLINSSIYLVVLFESVWGLTLIHQTRLCPDAYVLNQNLEGLICNDDMHRGGPEAGAAAGGTGAPSCRRLAPAHWGVHLAPHAAGSRAQHRLLDCGQGRPLLPRPARQPDSTLVVRPLHRISMHAPVAPFLRPPMQPPPPPPPVPRPGRQTQHRLLDCDQGKPICLKLLGGQTQHWW